MTLQIEFIHKPTKTKGMAMIITGTRHGDILVRYFRHSWKKSMTLATAVVMTMIVAEVSYGDILDGGFSLQTPEVPQEHGLY